MQGFLSILGTNDVNLFICLFISFYFNPSHPPDITMQQLIRKGSPEIKSAPQSLQCMHKPNVYFLYSS